MRAVAGRLYRDYAWVAGLLLPDRRVRRFCVLSTSRTGSELLVRLLDEHPRVRCESEILSEPHRFTYRWLEGRARLAAYRGAAAYGFKVSTFTLSPVFAARLRDGVCTLVDELSKRGFGLVHLRRRNLLRQALSVIRAHRSGDFHRFDSAADSHAPFAVDVPQLLAQMATLEAHDRGLTDILGPRAVPALWYEDDLEDPARHQATVDGIFEWLGLSRHDVHAALGKTGGRSLSDDITNADELAAVLRATRYAAFLDE